MNKCISQIMLGYAVVTNNPQISTITFFLLVSHVHCGSSAHLFYSAARWTEHALFKTYLCDNREKRIIDRVMQWLLKLLLRSDLSNFLTFYHIKQSTSQVCCQWSKEVDFSYGERSSAWEFHYRRFRQVKMGNNILTRGIF